MILVFYILLKITVAFDFILLVILIHCFCALIRQPIVDTFFLLLPVKYPYKPSWEIGRDERGCDKGH